MPRKPPFRECALCATRAKLQRSHIIPEFHYRSLYDHLHRFSVLSIDPAKPDRWAQKGYYEYLLCRNCELRFSTWEKYAEGAIFGNALHLLERRKEGVKLGGADYVRLRLYLLSVLWRMGVSDLDMFSNIDLGVHELPLRQLLLNGNPGEPQEYTCFITSLELQGKPCQDWIMKPDMVEVDGVAHCRAVISGTLYIFRLSVAPLPFPASVSIAKDGTLFMSINNVQRVPFLDAALSRQFEVIQKRESAGDQVGSGMAEAT